MIQGGDPTGTGRGGSSIYGGKFEDEISPELRFVGAGILGASSLALGRPRMESIPDSYALTFCTLLIAASDGQLGAKYKRIAIRESRSGSRW